MNGRIRLRDCPMCHEASNMDTGNGPHIHAQHLIDCDTGEDIGAVGYTASCVNCGTSVSEESLDAVARRWNGEDPCPYEDEEGQE